MRRSSLASVCSARSYPRTRVVDRAKLSDKKAAFLAQFVPVGFGIPDQIRRDPGAQVNVAVYDRDSQSVMTTSEAMRAAITTHFKGAGPVDPSPRLQTGYRKTSSVHQEREDSNSGPYRRVYTIPARSVGVTTTGEIATARLYCSNGNVPVINSSVGPKVNEPKSFNSGHTYLGGWSGQDDAADAGLQYNRNLSPGSADDYTAFVRDAPFKRTSPNGDGSGDYMFAYYDETAPNAYHAVGFTDGQSWHIPCGTDVVMTFGIQSFDHDQWKSSLTAWQWSDRGSTAAVLRGITDTSPSRSTKWPGTTATC